jgi:hypothetical protein
MRWMVLLRRVEALRRAQAIWRARRVVGWRDHVLTTYLMAREQRAQRIIDTMLAESSRIPYGFAQH